jgi:MoaA/NifB/PqqE/SkfB family radical SAM enzyme
MRLWTTAGSGLNVTMEISTYCNAGCPQCHRTNPDGLGKADWLPLIQWSLEEFKQAITKEDFKYIKTISFVGTWGDSIMNKDIFEIVEYVISNSVPVSIETNGSIRDENWWWNFGVMGGKLLTVRFDIDGIDQEMHTKYRRFTDLNKILSNMNTIAQTKAKIGSQTVVFKHNQDYLEEILQLCKNNGSSFHTNVISDRFNDSSSVKFYDKSGVVNDKVFYFTNENGEKENFAEASRNVLKNPIISGTSSNVLSEKIVCRWAEPRNSILIMPDGALLPCCYHGNGYFKYLQDGKEIALTKNPHFKEYLDNKQKYNVFENSIKDIINSEWFTQTLPDSFSADNPIPQCVQQCSSKIRKTHQLREFI